VVVLAAVLADPFFLEKDLRYKGLMKQVLFVVPLLILLAPTVAFLNVAVWLLGDGSEDSQAQKHGIESHS
jgi:hypothetical protein